MKKKSKVSILVLVFLLITVFYPLVEMLLRVEWSNFGIDSDIKVKKFYSK